MNRATAIIAGVLLVVLMVACWIASYYQGKSEKLEGTVKQLQSDNNLQTATIATQALHFQRANEISTAATQYGINTDAATQGKKLNTGRSSRNSQRVILLFPLLLLVGCSTTRTIYVPAQCQPIPSSLTQPVLAPLPPAS